jgi:formiminotetrahydrofolate cyclodeaminase
MTMPATESPRPLATTASIDDWLQAAGSRSTVPGGGAVAALAGALAAGMGEMATRFSHGRKNNSDEVNTRLSGAIARFESARALLLTLCEEDQAAYAAWRETKHLPDDDPARRHATAAALAVPQAVVATALAVLEVAIEVRPDANPWLLSDLLVCGDLATAAVRAGRYNVLANLDASADTQSARSEVDAQLDRAIRHVQALHAGE